MGNVGGLAGGVDDDEQMIAAIGKHQVVEDPARVIGQQAIALAALLQAQHGGRRQALEGQGQRLGIGAAQDHLTHVADVEQAGSGAGVLVFLHHAGGILHRHGIAREGHHLAAQLGVQPGQRQVDHFIGRCILAHWSLPQLPGQCAGHHPRGHATP